MSVREIKQQLQYLSIQTLKLLLFGIAPHADTKRITPLRLRRCDGFTELRFCVVKDVLSGAQQNIALLLK